MPCRAVHTCSACFTNYQPVTSKTFAISLLVEFLGVMLFSFLGTTVNDKVHGPWVNGLALAIMVYTAANISGGHLNPAVSSTVMVAPITWPIRICLQPIAPDTHRLANT